MGLMRLHFPPPLWHLQLVCVAAIALVWISSAPLGCLAKESLSQDESLLSNETLVSGPNKTFEFGLFSLGEDNGTEVRYYIGTWYYNITPRVYVWVGNRDASFPSLGADQYKVSMSGDGNLEVSNSTTAVMWRTNTTSSWGKKWVATLLDSGNLVIQDSSTSGFQWQSFEHPTDTFLESMDITMNETSRIGTLFRSWRAPDDPSSGDYTLGMDPAPDSTQLVLRGPGGKIRWRSGVFDGTYFNGLSGMRPLFSYGFELAPGSPGRGKSMTFRYFNRTQMRFTLEPNGTETTYIYEVSKGTWKPIWQQPTRDCEFFNYCGNNAICVRGEQAKVKCQCLPGFVNAAGWDGVGSSESAPPGCVRSTPLLAQQRNGTSNSSTTATSADLSKPDGLYLLKSMKLPDTAAMNTTATNEGDCCATCLQDNSCTACSYLRGCYTWSGDLVDMFQFTVGSDNGDLATSGGRLFVRLAGSEIDRLNNSSSHSRRNLAVVLAASVSSAAVAVAVIFIAVAGWRYNWGGIKDLWRRGRSVDPAASSANSGEQPKDHHSSTTAEYATAGAASGRAGGSLAIALGIGDDLLASPLTATMSSIAESSRTMNPPFDLPMFTLDEIDAFTGSFRESNKLGKGGFGLVYKGILPGGELVAVKRLSRESGQGQDEFKNEVALIARLQHNNLVRLQGCCVQGEERMLVYEYMPNKSLDAFLFSPTKQPLLDWRKRFSIIEGIARGLVYLHRDSRLKIVHRDLKASNILLDDEMNPKISDFGMARIFGNSQNQDNTNRIVGTFGYMSPEYAMEGLFSEKSDVYSFGVLTIEIISGRKNNRFRTDDHNNLLAYAWQLWNEGNAMDLVDPSIHKSCYFDQVIRCLHIALLCVQDKPSDRPKMAKVVIMLASDAPLPIMPKYPTFAAVGSSGETEVTITRYNDDAFSNNDVTITELTGR